MTRMTKEQLIESLPVIREALARCTGGDLRGDKTQLVITIDVDTDALFKEMLEQVRGTFRTVERSLGLEKKEE